MDIRVFSFYLAVIFSCLYATAAHSAVAVVVNLKNTSELGVKDIRRIFLGKIRTYPNGLKVETFDLPTGDTNRDEFRTGVLRKSESRLNAYWARMLFSSKAKPPVVLQSSAEIKAIIQANPKAIAYIDKKFVDASVRVILDIE